MQRSDELRLLRLVKSIAERINAVGSKIDGLILTSHKQIDAVLANSKAAQDAAKREPEKPLLTGTVSVELKKPVAVSVQGETRAQIRNPWDWRDWVRLGAELVGLGVLIWYAITTYNLWRSQRDANRLASIGLELQQRAYLTYGSVDQIPSGIKVHLSNIGHVPGTITGGSAHYFRTSYPENRNIANVTASVPGSIVVSPGPDSDAAILFELPQLGAIDESLLKTGREIMALNATVTYDTGFKSTDTLDIRISYERQTEKWVHVNHGTNVDFTRPENPQKR